MPNIISDQPIEQARQNVIEGSYELLNMVTGGITAVY